MMAEEGTTVLTGAAQAAARGELHGDIHANTAARDAAIGVALGIDFETIFPPLPTTEPEPATPPIAWNNKGILTAGPRLPEPQAETAIPPYFVEGDRFYNGMTVRQVQELSTVDTVTAADAAYVEAQAAPEPDPNSPIVD